MKQSRGLSVPFRAAFRHTLPPAYEFARAGGRLLADRIEYASCRAPGDLDYHALPFLRSLIDSGFPVVAEGDELVVKVSEGLNLRVPMFLAFAGLGMVDERFVRREFERFDVDDALVVDVGANIGDSAIYFITRGAYCVVAYEPFSATADVAARNISSNGLDARIQLERVGLGKADTTRQAAYDPQQPHIASAVEDHHDAAKTVEVHLTTLANALSRASSIAGSDHRIVLKVDCEGCEGEIFSSPLDLDGVGSVLVETHSDRLQRQVVAQLEAAGFACAVVSEAPHLSTAVLLATRPGSDGKPAIKKS
ncbi:MAG: FkbM family methyltransferase [Candidatus Dormibacteraeota bacterium]|nr:FkbM family methyltransferase [Candidatus Dormibacteraeota bacterium]